MKTMDIAFSKTTKLLFGKELSPIDDYEEWLLRRLPKGEVCDSRTSRNKVYFPNYAVFKDIPKDRLSDLSFLKELGERKISLSPEDRLKEISQKLERNSLFIVEFVSGKNQDVVDSTIYQNLYHAYKIVDCFDSKYIAYTFWVDNNEYLFGSKRTFNSKFSIHVYNSRKIMTSFEIDSCTNCSSSMFLHNCENVHDSLFCFNSKNLRYAIANQVVGREIYLEVRKMLSDKILQDLSKKGYFDLDIFNICL